MITIKNFNILQRDQHHRCRGFNNHYLDSNGPGNLNDVIHITKLFTHRCQDTLKKTYFRNNFRRYLIWYLIFLLYLLYPT